MNTVVYFRVYMVRSARKYYNFFLFGSCSGNNLFALLPYVFVVTVEK